MKLPEFLFRFRRLALIVIFIVAFLAPWERMGGAHPGSTWLWLAGTLAATGLLSIAASTIAVVALATVALLMAALVRTWAAAYMGTEAVQDKELHSDRVVADGPYRYLRNPLYLGTWLMTAALSILMPPGGALLALLAVTLLIVACIVAEERKLTVEQGEAYTVYLKRVPRWIPAIAPKVPAGAARLHWLQGFLGELHLWGMTLTYIMFAHRYDVIPLEQGVLISVGVMFLVRAIWREELKARNENVVEP